VGSNHRDRKQGSVTEIPELIEVHLIAKVIHWTTDKTRRFFTKTGMAGRIPGWRDSMVVRAHFQATMPQIYRLFTERYSAGELVSKRGNPQIRRNHSHLTRKKESAL
jgi:hypothetical protein